jgi:sortase A
MGVNVNGRVFARTIFGVAISLSLAIAMHQVNALAQMNAPVHQEAIPTPIPTVDVAAALQQYYQQFPPPDHIWIDKIRVNAKIEPVGPGKALDVNVVEWSAPPNRNVGWHNNSGRMGEGKNIVLNGHNNIYGGVFRRLYTLKAGDEIRLGVGDRVVTYRVEEVIRVLDRGRPIAERVQDAHYIQPMDDDRLTLVSCWPEWDNSHRVYVIARPVVPLAGEQ